MTKDEFEALVAERMARRPHWFELDRDGPATDEELAQLESNLGAQLPRQFRDFLLSHGAGMFAFLKVLGPKRGTGWEVSAHRHGLPVDFVPVADLETGDFYGHRVVDRRCDDEVTIWDHETGAIRPTQFDDFYSLVVAVALGG